MSLSTAAKNAILDGYLNGGTQHYVSLHTADPQLTGANEASGGSYARDAVDGAGSAANGEETNTAEVRWPIPPASTFTHIGLWQHATSTAAADFVWGGPLDTPVTGDAANDIIMDADALTFKL